MKTEQELTKQDLRTERGYLRKQYFELIVRKQGFESEIGLFASRINTQVPIFISSFLAIIYIPSLIQIPGKIK